MYLNPLEESVNKLEELCIYKKSTWSYHNGQLETTYTLPVTYEKHFEYKDGRLKQSCVRFVNVYGKRYDSSYCYIFNNVNNDVTFTVENDNYCITTNNKPKKYN